MFQEDLIYICQIFLDRNILRCHSKNLITNNAEFNMFNAKLQIQYTSPWSRFELKIPVVIGTDCIGSCKSNYHTITATTAPYIQSNPIVLRVLWSCVFMCYFKQFLPPFLKFNYHGIIGPWNTYSLSIYCILVLWNTFLFAGNQFHVWPCSCYLLLCKNCKNMNILRVYF
jgi:hypothetical protein